MSYKSYMSHTSRTRFFFRSALALALLFLACDLLPTGEFEPTGTQFTINSNINVTSITGDPDLSDMGPDDHRVPKAASRTFEHRKRRAAGRVICSCAGITRPSTCSSSRPAGHRRRADDKDAARRLLL